MPATLLDAEREVFPVAGAFTISRGSRREQAVVRVRVTDGRLVGRAECVPYARYGETVEGVIAAIRAAGSARLSREEILRAMPPGAARNGLDCALIDLETKVLGRDAASLLGIARPEAAILTCYTLSLAAPDDMARAAAEAKDKPLLKLKLGGGKEDAARLRAVRSARPDARLVADANEAWSEADLAPLLEVAAASGVELIEQPLPAGADAALAALRRPVPICADESAHTAADIPRLVGRYDAVNIKLDKAGGLGEALAMLRAARQAGLKVMTGCMLSTSLSMAPAWLLAGLSDWIDLDGPLLLAADREPAVRYEQGLMLPPPPGLWGDGA